MRLRNTIDTKNFQNTNRLFHAIAQPSTSGRTKNKHIKTGQICVHAFKRSLCLYIHVVRSQPKAQDFDIKERNEMQISRPTYLFSNHVKVPQRAQSTSATVIFITKFGSINMTKNLRYFIPSC